MATDVDLAPYVIFHPVHLELREDTPLKVLKATLAVCRDMKVAAEHNQAPSVKWYLGDAYNFAASRDFYQDEDEGFSNLDFVRESGYAFHGVSDASSVCRSYPPQERSSKLTFQHHLDALSLGNPDRANLLRKAEKERISAKDLRPMVRRIKEIERNEEVGNGVGAMVCPYCEGTGIFTHKHKK